MRRFDFVAGMAVGAIGALLLFCAPIALAVALGPPVHP